MYYNNSSRIVGEWLEYENKRKMGKHISSGRISPSKLAQTTQSAVLQMLGVPIDPLDSKVYGYFYRGQQVEDAILNAYRHSKTTIQTQSKHEYRSAVGYSDFISAGIPHEVKSVRTSKFWKILKERQPQISHSIQLCFYIVASNAPQGRIIYVNADDLQTIEFVIYPQVYKSNMDYRISAIIHAFANNYIPDYVALEDYHKAKAYSPYSEFYKTKGADAEQILKNKYPEKYELLKSGDIYRSWKLQRKDLIHLTAGLKKSLKITPSPEIATSSYMLKCASCSIHRLNDLSTPIEISHLYYEVCPHSTILLEQDEK